MGIDTRDKVNEDEEVASVTTEEQREELVNLLMDAEDWLYMDGEWASKDEYVAKIDSLKEKSDPIFARVFEAQARPVALEKAKTFIEVTRQVVETWNATKPWINATDKEELLMRVDTY